MEQDLIIKFCVVGEPSVGKTSMLYQYVHHKFDEKVRPTIGCDFSTKLNSSVDNKPVRLQLWDIAGQERFNAVSKMYLRGALGRSFLTQVASSFALPMTGPLFKRLSNGKKSFNKMQILAQKPTCPAYLSKTSLISLTTQLPNNIKLKNSWRILPEQTSFVDTCKAQQSRIKTLTIYFSSYLVHTLLFRLNYQKRTSQRQWH